MVNLIIDNKPVTVEEGTTILEAAKQINIKIPALCYMDLGELKMVNKVSSCRICSVEVEGRRNLAPSCSTPVAEGMKIRTNSKRVLFARRKLLELMLSNHPFDCLTCAKSTDCDLQSLAVQFGVNAKHFKGVRSSFPVDTSSQALRREPEKCIMCRRCETMCNEVQTVGAITAFGRGFDTVVAPAEMQPLVNSNCVYCGQCVTVCPTGALTAVGYMKETWDALFDPSKKVVVQVAPAIRAAIGEEFGMPDGTAVTGKLVAGLRQLGFDAVFDTTFGADLTIMEEGKEIIERIEKNENLPILTSCCPGWINFLEFHFPQLKYMPSTSKSPHQMMGTVVKTYYANKIGVKPEDMVVISVMPCIAKKYEAAQPNLETNGVRDVDYVITTRELAKMFKEAGIDLKDMPDEEFDNPLGESTGAGVIFGSSGGVLEAALRTVYEVVTGNKLENIDFAAVRGLAGVKEAFIDLNGRIIRVAATSGLGNARKILERVEDGAVKYDVIEIMACPGGCVNGGGQPFCHDRQEKIEARMRAIYDIDHTAKVRKSHENASVQKLYDEYFGEPGSEKAHELLHTDYWFEDSKA